MNYSTEFPHPFKPHLPSPSPHKFISQPKGLSFGPQDQKSGLKVIPGGTQKEDKESPGQNWPGKNVLPILALFPMKIKIKPFVFTND